MRKKLFYIIMLLACFFIARPTAIADEDECENVSYLSTAIYKFHGNDNYAIVIDKSKCSALDEATGKITCRIDTYTFPQFYETMNFGNLGPIYLYVGKNDEVIKDDTNQKWWSTLTLCHHWNKTAIAINSLDSTELLSYKQGECWTYTLDSATKDLPCTETTYSCEAYDNAIRQIADDSNKYKQAMSEGATEKQKSEAIEYKNKYKQKKEILRNLCSQALSRGDYNEGCVVSCRNLSNDFTLFDYDFDISHIESECVSDNLFYWIFNILKWIKYIIPIAVIILSTLDFIKAMAGEKDDELKKAQSRLVKRLIAAALIFLVPIIITFILEKMGFIAESCGLF